MITTKKEYYFYQKNRKEFEPVVDEEINILAKEKLQEVFKNRDKYKIPNRFIEQWNDVVLYNAKGNLEKAKAIFLTTINSAYDLSNPLNDLTAKEWLPETLNVVPALSKIKPTLTSTLQSKPLTDRPVRESSLQYRRLQRKPSRKLVNWQR